METRPGRILRLATLLVVGDVVTALAAILSGAPSMRAWAWAFHLDAPLDLGFWAPVFLVARNLVWRMLHSSES
jgi:hypothetical protein